MTQTYRRLTAFALTLAGLYLLGADSMDMGAFLATKIAGLACLCALVRMSGPTKI